MHLHTYATAGHVFPPRPTQYIWPVTLQNRQPIFQPHYDAPINNHIDDPAGKVKLNTFKFDGRLESTVFVDCLDG